MALLSPQRVSSAGSMKKLFNSTVITLKSIEFMGHPIYYGHGATNGCTRETDVGVRCV